MVETPTDNLEAGAGDLVADLLDRYWQLAYAEGWERRSTDTSSGDAQETLSAILSAFANQQAMIARLVAAGNEDVALMQEMGGVVTSAQDRANEAATQLAAVTAERDEALALVNYAEDISKQITAENARLREALERIEAWEMPATGKFWENADGTPSDRPMQYSACYGSNGERDYVRARARAALSQEAPK